MFECPLVLDDPFVAIGLPVPFAEFDSVVLCDGDALDPFDNDLDAPFVVLDSPSNLILEF